MEIFLQVFLVILLGTYKPNIRKIEWKLRETIWFEKKLMKDGHTAWHPICSDDYACNLYPL